MIGSNGSKKKNGTGPEPSPDRLDELLRRHGVELDAEQVEKLWAYHQLLRRRNRELNMTRIHNFENVVAKHYADSILVSKYCDLPSPLLDIGTGAGFPSIPLKIARPDLYIIMAEVRKKRTDFLEEAVQFLGLDNIEVLQRKIDERFDRPVSGVITRALERAPETLARIKHFLAAGGIAVFMKGPRCDAEVAEAREKEGRTYDLIEDLAYRIPETPHRRRLLVFRRTSHQSPAREEGFLGPALDISSPSNRSFSLFKKLLTSRGLRKEGKAILAGSKIVEEALRDHAGMCSGWISRMDHPPPSQHAPDGMTWFRLAAPLFKELDVSGTNAPLLLVERPPIPEWSVDDEWPSGCTLFVPFQDPENVGSVIRTAAAFGVSRIVLLQEAAHPFLPKACRAAGTAILKVPLLAGPSLQELCIEHPPLLALSTSGESINGFKFPPAFGLIAGLEGGGLPETIQATRTLSIPMASGAESLNAATAMAVALFAWRSR